MGQVIVRNLDDEIIERHRERARLRSVSLEQELRDVLTEAASLRAEERRRRVDGLLALTPPELPEGVERTPGWVLIREDRDSR